jgi:hypothetical protein
MRCGSFDKAADACWYCGMKCIARLVNDDDLPEIQRWLDYRPPDTVDVTLRDRPANGFIVPGVMAMFYSITDSQCLWIDQLIANPEAERSARHEAGRTFAAMLFTIAKAAKLRRICALTKNKNCADFYRTLINAKLINSFELYQTDFGDWDDVEPEHSE